VYQSFIFFFFFHFVSYHNSQNTPNFLRKKNYKDLGYGQDLIEFEKIFTPESLKIKIKIKIGILKILTGFNRKS
jgi:hypothetical protein